MARHFLPSTLTFLYFVLVAGCQLGLSVSVDNLEENTFGFPSVTVRGFLNFRTTVDGTVIVFTSATSEEAIREATNAREKSSAFELEGGSSDGIQQKNEATPLQNYFETMPTRAPEIHILENKIGDQDLPHISDNAVLQSVNELDKKGKLPPNPYPTGLVTLLGETVVEGSSTTIYETKVMGTYIDGKYAQILQSTFRILDSRLSTDTSSDFFKRYQENSNYTNKISTSMETLSTKEGSTLTEINVAQPIRSNMSPSESVKEITATFSYQTPSRVLSLSSITKEKSEYPPRADITSSMTTAQSSFGNPSTVARDSNFRSRDATIKQTSELTLLQSSFGNPSMVVKDGEFRSQDAKTIKTPELTFLQSSFGDASIEIINVNFQRQELTTHKTPPMTLVTLIGMATSEELNKNASRKRFLPPHRPSQRVRLNRFKVKLTLRQNETMQPFDDEVEDLASKDDDLGILMSTNPAQVVFQETTITSEVTLHVGRRKSIRTLTITTSIPLTVNPTDIQDMFSSQSTTEPRECSVLTKTYTTTENAMKTSIVPIFDGKSTMYHTVTESFFIMKIITAFRTLPSGNPSILESFFHESQSTATLDAHAIPSSTQSLDTSKKLIEDTTAIPTLPLTTSPHKTLPFLSFGPALPNNPLAALYLGLQQLNAQITMYSTVTDLSTSVITKTLHNTKTNRYNDGRSTRHRLKYEPISTIKVTLTKTITSLKPYINTDAVKQQQQLQKLIAATQTPLNTVTSTYTTVTTVTSLSTRIYTLIYNGFSTKYRTVTSTSLYPTTVTQTTLLIAPTQLNVPFIYPNTK